MKYFGLGPLHYKNKILIDRFDCIDYIKCLLKKLLTDCFQIKNIIALLLGVSARILLIYRLTVSKLKPQANINKGRCPAFRKAGNSFSKKCI